MLVTTILGGSAWTWRLIKSAHNVSVKIEHFEETLDCFKDDLETMSNQVVVMREQVAAVKGELTIIRSLLTELAKK